MIGVRKKRTSSVITRHSTRASEPGEARVSTATVFRYFRRFAAQVDASSAFGGPSARSTVVWCAIAAVALSSPAAGQQASWRSVFPSPRYQHAMVYDKRRNVTVLFGGFTPGINGE